MHAAVALALLIAQPAPKEPPKLDPFVAKAIEPDANDTPLRKLQKERVRERAAALQTSLQLIELGRWRPSDFGDFSKLQATLAENLAELMDKPADKVWCYEMRLSVVAHSASAIGRPPEQPQH